MYTSSPNRLLRNIELALSNPDLTPEWREALETARLEVLARYPKFNSKSTLPVTCPVCEKVREVRVLRLYNLVGMNECLSCHSRHTLIDAQSNKTSEQFQEFAKKARSARTPESFRHSPESYQKMVVTRHNNTILAHDTAHY